MARAVPAARHTVGRRAGRAVPMIGRIFADRSRLAATRRADRLAAVVIALLQAVVAAAGWLVDPIWLAVAIAAQLLLGGLAAVYVIGPMKHELGLAALRDAVGGRDRGHPLRSPPAARPEPSARPARRGASVGGDLPRAAHRARHRRTHDPRPADDGDRLQRHRRAGDAVRPACLADADDRRRRARARGGDALGRVSRRARRRGRRPGAASRSWR